MAKFSLRIQQTDQEGKYFFCLMLNNLIKKILYGSHFLGGMRRNLKHEVMWSESNTNLLPRQQPGPVGNVRTFLNSAQFYIVKKKRKQKSCRLSSMNTTAL